MIPTLAVRESMSQLLAADTATLASVTANKVALVKEQFTPSESLALEDLSLADFDGSTPIDCGTGTQPEGLDPINTDSIISIKPPAGGFRFETSGITNLPQTIYGFCLHNNAGNTLLGAALLPGGPVTLTAVNQVLLLPPLTFRQSSYSVK